jgi:hypothetical protein
MGLEVCPGALRGSAENGLEACNPTMKKMMLEGNERTPLEK